MLQDIEAWAEYSAFPKNGNTKEISRIKIKCILTRNRRNKSKCKLSKCLVTNYRTISLKVWRTNRMLITLSDILSCLSHFPVCEQLDTLNNNTVERVELRCKNIKELSAELLNKYTTIQTIVGSIEALINQLKDKKFGENTNDDPEDDIENIEERVRETRLHNLFEDFWSIANRMYTTSLGLILFLQSRSIHYLYRKYDTRPPKGWYC